MKKRSAIFICILIGIIFMAGCKQEVNQLGKPKAGNTVAYIEVRDYGTIKVRFFDQEAPKAVENFVTHAKKGYYDGQSFYRIIEGSRIESGDPTKTGTGGESIWGEYFKDEFDPDLQPYYGALCMENYGVDKNSSEFFIVQSKKTFNEKILNQIEDSYNIEFSEKARKLYATKGGEPWFYEKNTVFGQVYDGYDVLEKISKVKKTDEEKGIPAEEVIIDHIKIAKYKRGR